MAKKLLKSISTDRESYQFYKELSKYKLTINQYLDILYEYAKTAMDFIFEGYAVDMLGGIGTFFIEKVTRSEENRRIDWANSKRDENGKLVSKAFYTDGFYVLFRWHKPPFSNRTLRYSEFRVARGQADSPHNILVRLKKRMEDVAFVANLFVAYKLQEIKAIDPSTGLMVASYASMKDVALDYPNRAKVRSVLDSDKLAYNLRWEGVYRTLHEQVEYYRSKISK